MGRRDVPPREHRKPSKSARKEAVIDLAPAAPPPPAVEVIKRKRKEQIEEE